ncbi:hypothetical protein HI914_03635 [Erysiphe necator]|nr:hypothetical protein HI914_03635 [Erysiphe necator]
MPSATASGTDSKNNGSARSRNHNQGNQERKYTTEQKAEVIRVRRCSPTAFYDILGLEKSRTTVTDTEIKKAYRRISLLTHPDKNGHEHADEAFKMVSRAFGVLGDKDKRAKYDRFGGDPDSRFGGQQSSSPFSGFSEGRTPRSNNGAWDWQQELTPEEMFRRFFGGGPMGGFGRFDTGPGFVFNMAGGPGIRVQQFGGATPRRRPRGQNSQEEPPASLRQVIMGLLPLLMILFLPFISSILSGSSSTETGPSMRFDNAIPPHTLHRHTSRLNVDYYINPKDVDSYTNSQWKTLDKKAEINYINRLNLDCQQEELIKKELINQAYGWFFTDQEKLNKAYTMPMIACSKLEKLGKRQIF